MSRKDFAKRLHSLAMRYATDQLTREEKKPHIQAPVLDQRQVDHDILFHQLYADFCAMEKAEESNK